MHLHWPFLEVFQIHTCSPKSIIQSAARMMVKLKLEYPHCPQDKGHSPITACGHPRLTVTRENDSESHHQRAEVLQMVTIAG